MNMTSQIPERTIQKLQTLPEDKKLLVFSIIDQLSAKPIDIFHALRESGKQSPMTEDEVDAFIEGVRTERYAAGH